MLWMIGGVVVVVFILLRIFGGNANSPK